MGLRRLDIEKRPKRLSAAQVSPPSCPDRSLEFGMDFFTSWRRRLTIGDRRLPRSGSVG